MSPAPSWHLLTGEYPPQPGGVGDYSRLVALGLVRAGQEVHVWAPGEAGTRLEDGVTVHRVPALFTPVGLRRLARGLDGCPGPRRLLLQYVPHSFGLKAMNVPFCAWFAARRQEERWVFFHEVVYPWSARAPLKHQVLAGATRVMVRMVASAADRVFVSIPAWAEHLPSRARRHAELRPVPSNIPTDAPEAAVQAVRAKLGGERVVGHFGTYSSLIAEPLERVLVPLLRADSGRRALLLGRGGEAFRDSLTGRHPELASRLHAPGGLAPEDAAAHLRACDVLLQPFPDGVSARRGSVMAGLGLGMPIVTNSGHLTEPLWRELRPVALVDGAEPGPWTEAVDRLLTRPEERAALRERATRVYREHFALERTLEALLRPSPT
ncbi:glycosyltransferase family 4 protein [Pyxidicoccus fallax]|uniref:Glycosyltransferase family 4 protein n=1 Tax=Pyxidicoccus fallax TaxID=394095 RepID=A0A848LQD9_9BACT|nr:glycosyltransferase family 4 protein [Pyxidicoccus fallax]NMO19694.1 glycosyltransferase family 4 protein [Pyxidicoccus fallax]NPC80139.1 glycosyltransferase family 4 protein [Pyxidicoccus fallax]